ncbi:MAG: T9SS type A sorting domain-containing protein [Bacteroidetes bacterium]|nr:T9SS type A sorting domain-containing protein [Bacteroidota bacterium]
MNDNVYITGDFQSNLDFGNFQLFNSNLADMFICKADSMGIWKWCKQGNASNGMDGLQLSLGSDGTIYQMGYLDGNASFDTFSLTSSGNGEHFIHTLNDSGNSLSARLIAINSLAKMTLDISNNIYISGSFYQAISLDLFLLSSTGYDDVFIGKYDLTLDTKELEKSNSRNQLFIHANPNEGKCNISVPNEFLHERILVLSIYNSLGKLIQQKNLEMSDGKVKLSLEAEAKGLYNAVLSNGTKSYSGKIVFE